MVDANAEDVPFAMSDDAEELVDASAPEVNISPKISIYAQSLKMALHRNSAMHGSRMVIFLHDSKKSAFLARLKALFLHNSKGNSLNLHDII